MRRRTRWKCLKLEVFYARATFFSPSATLINKNRALRKVGNVEVMRLSSAFLWPNFRSTFEKFLHFFPLITAFWKVRLSFSFFDRSFLNSPIQAPQTLIYYHGKFSSRLISLHFFIFFISRWLSVGIVKFLKSIFSPVCFSSWMQNWCQEII